MKINSKRLENYYYFYFIIKIFFEYRSKIRIVCNRFKEKRRTNIKILINILIVILIVRIWAVALIFTVVNPNKVIQCLWIIKSTLVLSKRDELINNEMENPLR